ncbi:MAG: potassium channel protein [Reichenbachiella sp.]
MMGEKKLLGGIILRREIRRFVLAIVMFLLSIIIGVSGFYLIEGFNFSEAVYMTMITFSTVGFNEVRPLSVEGRWFTSFYILYNLCIFAYVVSVVSHYMFEGEFNRLFKKYFYDKEVRNMEHHVIVCGFGRNGSKACEELKKNNVDFVVLERDEERIIWIKENTAYKAINGDATTDEVLYSAGILKARALIIATPNDAENVFMTLTARELNRELNIVSRASEETSEKKLLRAGATTVIMPDTVGGIHMAQHITQPAVVEYLEILSGGGDSGLVMEEIHAEDLKESYSGKTIEELDIRNKTGVSVVGFKNENAKFIFNPSSKEVLSNDTVVIILGMQDEVHQFKSRYLA